MAEVRSGETQGGEEMKPPAKVIPPPNLFVPLGHLEFAARKFAKQPSRIDISYHGNGQWCVTLWDSLRGVCWWNEQITGE